MSEPMKPTGIAAVYYLAKDLARGVAFYRDVIGLPVAREEAHFVEFELGDGSAFGVSHMPGVWYPGGGVMFEVPDINAAVARLREAGVQFYTDGALESPVCHVAWCADPEGNNFALHQRK
jgi:predicted enzyme related to lactoylglutathione lyase